MYIKFKNSLKFLLFKLTTKRDRQGKKSLIQTQQTLGFLIWYGHPEGMMTASPTCCSKVHGSISNNRNG